MAKKKFIYEPKQENFLLPFETIIDVVATKGDKVVIQKMSFLQAITMKKTKGWYYRNYKEGAYALTV